MAVIKISNLPEVTTISSSDLLTAVASNVSSKITVANLSNSLTEVSSSISASYAVTASYALNAGGGGSGSSGTSGANGSSGTSGQTGANGSSGTSGQTGGSGSSGTSGQTGGSGSSGTSGQTGSSGTSGVSGFPFTGDAVISGSLTTTGSIYIKDGSIVFSTAVSDYDKGIKFANPLFGSSDPNTLEYYEEGTWDPTLSSSGATFSYSQREGVYTRIGDIVKISFFIQLNTSGNSGFGANALTMNLPKTANDNAAVGDLHWSNTANTAIRFPYQIVGSTVNFYKTTAATVDTFALTMKSNDLSTTLGSIIYGTIVYKV